MLSFPGGRSISRGHFDDPELQPQPEESDEPKLVPKDLKLPTLPHVAAKVAQMTRERNTTAAQLERVISVDQSLAAQVLRIANSSFYGLSRVIRDIRQALVVLGFGEVERLMLAACASAIYEDPDEVDHAMWQHAVGVAVGSKIIARNAAVPRHNEVFLAGLMHDVGQAVLRLNLREEMTKTFERSQATGIPFATLENELVHVNHHAAGLRLAEQWHFPQVVQDTILFHHEPAQAENTESAGGLVASVALADWICREAGIGRPDFAMPNNNGPAQHQRDAALKLLNLEASQLDSVIESVVQAYEEEAALFQV